MCRKLNACSKYQVKTSSLNMKLIWNKIKLTGSNCDLSCLTLLQPPVGWYIMGYESDPLPSCRWIRNCSYPKKITIVISGLLYLPSHVLFPPPHESTRPRNLLCPRAQPISGPVVNVRRNVVLKFLYVLLDGPYPCYLQGVFH